MEGEKWSDLMMAIHEAHSFTELKKVVHTITDYLLEVEEGYNLAPNEDPNR